MSEYAARMMNLFAGYADAHGTHGATTGNAAKGGKQEIKKTAKTIRSPVTVELWTEHLAGDRPIGIIPTKSDGTCVWACIDIDKYDMDLAEIAGLIDDAKLPMTICRTKSGGAHAYVFFKQPESAEEVRNRMREVASAMGWGDCEIFPKQNQILSEQGDLGNWLNMPYLGGNSTMRYGIARNNVHYTLRAFLERCEKMKVGLSDLRVKKASASRMTPSGSTGDETLGDGPPCLQILSDQGFPDGTRNSGLFALGIYCKKKYGSKWKDYLEQYNHDFMKPPLTSDEVAEVVKRLDKKDYRYSCRDQPLCSHCNSSLCRTRKFGVGSSGMYPEISGLTKLDTDPPIWFLDILDQRISLTTEQLQNYRDFQKQCMNQLTVYYMPMANGEWATLLGDAMESVMILEAAPELSTRGHFMELLEDFCMNRHKGQNREDLFLGKPWHDPETGLHYFKLTALMAFLDREGFRAWGRNTVGKVITEEIGGKMFMNIKGKGINVIWVRDDFTTIPEIPLPISTGDPI